MIEPGHGRETLPRGRVRGRSRRTDGLGGGPQRGGQPLRHPVSDRARAGGSGARPDPGRAGDRARSRVWCCSCSCRRCCTPPRSSPTSAALRADARRPVPHGDRSRAGVTVVVVAVVGHGCSACRGRWRSPSGRSSRPPTRSAATAIMRRLGVPAGSSTSSRARAWSTTPPRWSPIASPSAAAVGGSFSLLDASARVRGGARRRGGLGLAVGWSIGEIRRRIDDPPDRDHDQPAHRVTPPSCPPSALAPVGRAGRRDRRPLPRLARARARRAGVRLQATAVWEVLDLPAQRHAVRARSGCSCRSSSTASAGTSAGRADRRRRPRVSGHGDRHPLRLAVHHALPRPRDRPAPAPTRAAHRRRRRGW